MAFQNRDKIFSIHRSHKNSWLKQSWKTSDSSYRSHKTVLCESCIHEHLRSVFYSQTKSVWDPVKVLKHFHLFCWQLFAGQAPFSREFSPNYPQFIRKGVVRKRSNTHSFYLTQRVYSDDTNMSLLLVSFSKTCCYLKLVEHGKRL